MPGWELPSAEAWYRFCSPFLVNEDLLDTEAWTLPRTMDQQPPLTGSLLPNACGLYDTHGLVREWLWSGSETRHLISIPGWDFPSVEGLLWPLQSNSKLTHQVAPTINRNIGLRPVLYLHRE